MATCLFNMTLGAINGEDERSEINGLLFFQNI